MRTLRSRERKLFAQESDVTQLCPTLCDPMGSSLYQAPPSMGFLSKSTGVGCHFLLQGIFLMQGIFLTQGSNPGLLQCRQTLYHLSHQGSPQWFAQVHSPIDDLNAGPQLMQASSHNSKVAACDHILIDTGWRGQRKWGISIDPQYFPDQWLRLCAFIAGGPYSIPGWRTKIPYATQCWQKRKTKQNQPNNNNQNWPLTDNMIIVISNNTWSVQSY